MVKMTVDMTVDMVDMTVDRVDTMVDMVDMVIAYVSGSGYLSGSRMANYVGYPSGTIYLLH